MRVSFHNGDVQLKTIVLEVPEGREEEFARWMAEQAIEWQRKLEPEEQWLPEPLREEVKSALHDRRMDGSFGDGMESEYIYGGCSMVGLNEMSDDELVREYEEDTDLGEPDELLARVTAARIVK